MSGADGFGDQAWFEAWAEAFHPSEDAIWLRIPGVAEPVLFIADTVRVFKSRRRFLRAPVNDHTPRWGLRLIHPPPPGEVSAALREALRKAGCDGFEWGLIAAGAGTHRLVEALAATGEWIVDVQEGERTALVDATGDWSAYYEARPKNLRKNLAQRERRLRERGALAFEDAAERADWRDQFRRFLELERAGWKGREGTAILQHPEQARFYERVAESAHTRGVLRLITATLDGKLIAARMDVIDGGIEYFLKTTYDETLATFSPGHFVRREALRRAFADPRVHAVDFLGPVSPEKVEWATCEENLLKARLVLAGSTPAWLLKTERVARRVKHAIAKERGMAGFSRRAFLRGLSAVTAGAAVGHPQWASAAGSESRVQWEDLGPRSEETAYRAWFTVARRAADGAHYIYSGTTRPENHLLRFDPVAERWVIHKRGNGKRPWFPDPGAEFPASVDNGFAVWDNINDELWVNCVNPWGAPLPNASTQGWNGFSAAIFNGRTNSWRAVTREEFPTFDFALLPVLFNAGSSSGPEHLVIYGGSRNGALSHLWVHSCRTRVWRQYPYHGEKGEGPGPVRNIQNQLQWIPSLNAFLLYVDQRVFTLSLDWIWRRQATTGDPPIDGRSINMVLLPSIDSVAVVAGRSADVWLLDLKRWGWSRVAAQGPLPPLPRWDGGAWVEGRRIYMCWGQEDLAPAALIRRLFRASL